MRLLNIPESIDFLDEQTTKRGHKFSIFFKKRRKPTTSMKVMPFILILPREVNLQSKPFFPRRQIMEVRGVEQ